MFASAVLLVACTRGTPTPPAPTGPSSPTETGQLPTGETAVVGAPHTGHTGASTPALDCAVDTWSPAVWRSSERPCAELGYGDGCFPGEVCADVCRIDCSGGEDCPSSEACTTYEWTYTSPWEKVEYAIAACVGPDLDPLPEGPLNGLSAFDRVSLGGPLHGLVPGDAALWTFRPGSPATVASVALAADGSPTPGLTDRGPLPVDALPSAGLEVGGRLYLLFLDRVWSAPVGADQALGAWQEEADLGAPIVSPALLQAGERLVVAAGSISGAPSPLLLTATPGAEGRIDAWTTTFVVPVGAGGRHAAVVGDRLALLDEQSALWTAPLDTLPVPTFERLDTPTPHVTWDDRRVDFLGSLCDALVAGAEQPSLWTQLLPFDALGPTEAAWRLGSLVSEEWRVSDWATRGQRVYALDGSGAELWSASRVP